jgi:hypothetical protein
MEANGPITTLTGKPYTLVIQGPNETFQIVLTKTQARHLLVRT